MATDKVRRNGSVLADPSLAKLNGLSGAHCRLPSTPLHRIHAFLSQHMRLKGPPIAAFAVD